MAFRLKTDESFSDGIRRIVVEQLKKAADQLSNPDKVDRGVHEARKGIKKVRSVLRLLQPEMLSASSAENGQLRTLARGLSGLRDDAVMLEVFDLLRQQRGDRFAAIRQGLEKSQRDAKQVIDVAKTFRETALGLRTVRRRVENWPVPQALDDVMASGFETTYQRGKKALRKALESPVPDHLHQLRKRVKEHRYHLSLLSVLPEEAKRLQDLHKLEILLGDDHNLSVLRDRLDQNTALYGDPLEAGAFLALLTRRQRQLQALALPLGRRLYAVEDANRLMHSLMPGVVHNSRRTA